MNRQFSRANIPLGIYGCLSNTFASWFLGVALLVLAGISQAAVCEPPCGWPQALGQPQTQSQSALDIELLRNPGFVVGYDKHRGRPAWVGYQVTPIKGYKHLPRPKFTADKRVADYAASKDVYRQRRYDRGHLAPNYVIAQLYGRAAQKATFKYSNIEPQSQRLNQLLWQRLEEIETDYLAPRLHRLWVLAGPVYAAGDGRIPSAFFRIWVTENAQGHWDMMAFIMPQDVRGDERLDDYLVPVTEVEAKTGLSFYPKLKTKLQQKKADATLWQFDAVACQPARYQKHWQGRDGIKLNFDRCDN